MKRFVLFIIFFSILLSGCYATTDAKNEPNKPGKLVIHSYDENRIEMSRSLKRGFLNVRILCENYRNDPTITYTLYKDEKEVKEEDGVYLNDASIKLIRSGDVLKLVEHAYYKDEENPSNNFVYNQITEILLQDAKDEEGNDILLIYHRNPREVRWNVIDLSKAMFYSFKTGMYNPHVLCGTYTYVCYGLFVFLLWMIIKNVYVHSILREKYKRLMYLDIANIIVFGFAVIVNYSQHTFTYKPLFNIHWMYVDAILKTIVIIGLMIRLYLSLKIKNDFLKDPPDDYDGHTWILNVHKKYRWLKK